MREAMAAPSAPVEAAGVAIIDKYQVLQRAFNSAHHIHVLASNLRAFSAAIPFSTLQGHLDSMRESYVNNVSPMLALGTAAQVNSVVGTFYAGTLPANTYTQFQAVGTALLTFYTAYDAVFDTLTPIEFDPSSGHSYADIPLAQLATLADELDGVIAAVAPLV
jgi:hypothetical protein